MDFLSIVEGDDPIFIRNCEKIIQDRILYWNPKELFIISINTTFAKASIEYNAADPREFAFSSAGDKLTVTRYHPNIYEPSSTVFLRSYRGYEQKADASYIKKRKREEYRSYENSYGPKECYYEPIDDGLIIYYSQNTLSREEATIMFFQRFEAQYDGILVTLSKDNNWNVSDAHGISMSEMQEIINNI
ncbi:hypothetical protein [Kordia sp. SMS9]|uniref:hypothetical protein n=1 Tax=Kordia sp. SMS9 TaxID=2282170 RepID=UPI000E0D1769|nr:hypothetical protein [Kordia sp. SMS9]